MHTRIRAAAVAAATGAALTTALATGTAHAADPVTGERRTLVVVVGFQDAKFPDTDLVKEYAASSYFGGRKSLAGYFAKVSQGAFTYVPAVPEKVVGPYELDLAQKPCDAGRVNAATRKALEADGYVRGEDYDSLSVIQPGKGSDCNWSGLGSMPGPYTWVSLVGQEIGEDLLVHEFGHNQGFAHHLREKCAGGDLGDCTTGGTSGKTPMGGGGAGVGFTAPELISRGWLPDGQAVTVEKSATYELAPLHGTKEGVRALDIPMGEDRLVIEYRHEDASYTNRYGTLDAKVEGVHAYRVPKGSYTASRLIDTTEEDGGGDTDAITRLTDTAHRIDVEVRASGGGSATVAVSLNGAPAPSGAATAPGKGAEAPAPQQRSGEGEPVSEDGTDADAPADSAGGNGGGNGGGDGTRAAAAAAQDGENLADTGGDFATPFVAAGGAALVVLGAAVVLRVRRNRV
ncbi:LAETG motif-containing sortase-dependent surface protein [Streptomyces barkulensis]|uniref:LAETG motif-containing sortase-dependent surface protein n=1 Tax=Streptomyces barkulensis TaxID=1257026 RepID=UPI000C6DA882|nr:LAETG motif-containing sortase-dependent surface protein [Streptomyces barkulensis]